MVIRAEYVVLWMIIVLVVLSTSVLTVHRFQQAKQWMGSPRQLG